MNSPHQETSEEEAASMSHLYEQLEKNNVEVEKDLLMHNYGFNNLATPSPSRPLFGQGSRYYNHHY
jgi:hypothetical protein